MSENFQDCIPPNINKKETEESDNNLKRSNTGFIE